MKWFISSEAKQRAAAAKAHAISEFKKRFPRANISRFQVQVDFDTNRKATGSVLFTESDGSRTDPLIKGGKYWSQALKDALGFHQDGGFPPQLSPFIQTKIQKPIPAVDFSEEIQQSIGNVLNKPLRFMSHRQNALPPSSEKFSRRHRSNSHPHYSQECGSEARTLASGHSS